MQAVYSPPNLPGQPHLPAQLEGELLKERRRDGCDGAARRRPARERDDVHARMGDEGGARLCAEPVDEVEDAWRHARGLHKPRERAGSARRDLRGLCDDAVPAGECRCDLRASVCDAGSGGQERCHLLEHSPGCASCGDSP